MKSLLQVGLLTLASLLPGMQELSGQTPAPLSKNEGPYAWRSLTHSIQQLVLDERFAELEAMHQKFLTGKERFTEGRDKIEFFYSPLDGSGAGQDDEAAAQIWLKKIEAWKKAYPDSPLPRIAEAKWWTNQAWEIRESTRPKAITDEVWGMFFERLSKAKVLLLNFKENAPPGRLPYGWYETMFSVALGQSWNKKRFDVLFQEAVTAYPGLVGFYFKKAHHLLPHWHGKEGELEAFAEKVRTEGNPEFYTRIIWSQRGYYPKGNVFKSPYVRWEWMRDGFEVIMQKQPQSDWNRSNFCRFACEAGDKATAQRLFSELKGSYWYAAWPDKEAYTDYLAWASKKD